MLQFFKWLLEKKNGVYYSSLISTKNTIDPPKVSSAFYPHWDTVYYLPKFPCFWLKPRDWHRWGLWNELAGREMAVDVPKGSDGDTGLSSVFQKSQQKPDITHTTAAQGKRICFGLRLHQLRCSGHGDTAEALAARSVLYSQKYTGHE